MDIIKYKYKVTLKDDGIYRTESEKAPDGYKKFLESGIGGIVTGDREVKISALNLKSVEDVTDSSSTQGFKLAFGAYQEGDKFQAPEKIER